MLYGVHGVYLEIPCNYVVGRAWLSCKAPVYQIQTVITGFHPEYNRPYPQAIQQRTTNI